MDRLEKNISQKYLVLVFKILLIFVVNLFVYFNQKIKELLANYYFKLYFTLFNFIGVEIKNNLKKEDFILIFSFNCTTFPLYLLFFSLIFILFSYSTIKREFIGLIKTLFLIELLNFVRLFLLIIIYNSQLFDFDKFYYFHLLLSSLFSLAGLVLIYFFLTKLKKYEKPNTNLF